MKQTVRVTFAGNDKEYAYVCYDENVKVGDLAIVENARFGVSVVKVVAVNTNDWDKATVDLVQLIDFTAYNERKAKKVQVAKLKAQMASRAKQFQEIQLYQMLAEKDEVMATMLAQLQDLM